MAAAPEEEQTSLFLGRIFLQDTEFDLESGDALPLDFRSEPLLLRGRGHAVRRRRPAVAVAQQHKQERAAALDLVEADLQDQQFAGLFGARLCGLDPEAEVDRFKMMPAFPQFFFQPRKDTVAQPVPLGVHVLERGTDEDRAGAPGTY